MDVYMRLCCASVMLCVRLRSHYILMLCLSLWESRLRLQAHTHAHMHASVHVHAVCACTYTCMHMATQRMNMHKLGAEVLAQ